LPPVFLPIRACRDEVRGWPAGELGIERAPLPAAFRDAALPAGDPGSERPAVAARLREALDTSRLCPGDAADDVPLGVIARETMRMNRPVPPPLDGGSGFGLAPWLAAGEGSTDSTRESQQMRILLFLLA
jgi:hypothetical protein